MKNKSLIIVLTLLAIAHLLISLPAMRYPERFRVVDSEQYIDLANGLLQVSQYRGIVYQETDLLRPPGYPVFLALIKLVFSDFRWTSLVQVLFVFVNCYLLYQIGIDLGSRKVGVVSILLYLLSLNAAFGALAIMTETITSLWLTVALWAVLRFLITNKSRWLVCAGLSLGMGSLTRPIIFVFWIIVLLILILIEKKKGVRSGRKIRDVFVFALSGFLLVVLWQTRNYIVHGQFALSTVGETTIVNYIFAESVAGIEHVSRDAAADLILLNPDPVAYMVNVIKEHPWEFLKMQGRGILRTVLGVSYPNWAEQLTGVRPASTGIVESMSFTPSIIGELLSRGNYWLLAGFFALFVDILMGALCIITFYKLVDSVFKKPMMFTCFLLLLSSIIFMILTPAAHGSERFRIPVETYLALLAGLAFYQTQRAIPADSQNISGISEVDQRASLNQDCAKEK
jgi:4-amino-4-deoxy-L-arabinose transferase-like glycosyltransferase